MISYIYDGSFEGFLTLVFEAYERKAYPETIMIKGKVQPLLFGEPVEVFTDESKSSRVWRGLIKKVSHGNARKLYRAFLSEQSGVEMLLFRLISDVFDRNNTKLDDFRQAEILELHRLDKMIGREVHRMHAFVRFRKSKDGLYFALIEPDFNVIPLIGSHFKKRYTDQPWLILDIRRNYGIHYDLKEMKEVRIIERSRGLRELYHSTPEGIEESDDGYQELWRTYFNSVNIPERKNLKLHLQHVPVRYWKYLPEKHNTSK
ncbi:TIGR03915 family putative DNA repair protein [Roseivirga sp. BDSF3-8]|uniref:TIGR03915 family putative DNA repair protein n=1 Tax=Roseivirga sp. BDSF3-8 TaxID=3241598 RepID=UPI0035320B28